MAWMTSCVTGISRSATIVIAYLMKTRGKTLQEAFRHVRDLRPVVHPNAGFIQELERFDNHLRVKKGQPGWVQPPR